MTEPKLCKCGCGRPVPLARRTRKDRGTVKGQYLTYLPKHNLKNYLIPPPEEYIGPPAYCQCGCGKYVPIATHTRTDRGQFRGQPTKYLSGHYRRSGPAEKKVPAPRAKQEDKSKSIQVESVIKPVIHLIDAAKRGKKAPSKVKSDYAPIKGPPCRPSRQVRCIDCGEPFTQDYRTVIYQPRCHICATNIVEQRHRQAAKHFCHWCGQPAGVHSGSALTTVLWACLGHWDNLRSAMRMHENYDVLAQTASLARKIAAEY